MGEIVTALRPVEIGDVLGRESVDLKLENLRDFYVGKNHHGHGCGGQHWLGNFAGNWREWI